MSREDLEALKCLVNVWVACELQDFGSRICNNFVSWSYKALKQPLGRSLFNTLSLCDAL
ncbi:hypothetical protein GUITHDRAFT_149875 [Guillardia theta CCMP2712]|uniref:Uncharacterized protein n=1 Tax=Guillardia theta (strain CCMP2712) TaxID=905079 RepID=L1K1Y8_GUITC|nr:hypothetical protein GUITHDRAFT_149875 [Guillardia theta CCMP2712]EKX54831.1 hypothetical protein GUITHDRAFT_149875 [Guillardia theta CCMP2712]|eukprot:XP_005841811.1 hypothetical protein GUITHDRAFT_149875 [Guillardia theta CCMP2712]